MAQTPKTVVTTVWHHTSLLMPFCGFTGPVVHLQGLTGSRKASVKADLAIYTHVLGVPGQYESVALMLSHKMYFNCCASRDGFRKSSHIFCSELLRAMSLFLGWYCHHHTVECTAIMNTAFKRLTLVT